MAAGTRSALIVANDEYADPGLRRLRAPAEDAEALARVLGDPAIGGFQVKTVANQPEHRLRREIAAFFSNRGREDLLLAHFSCHGVKDDNGQLYFATVDTEVGNLEATAVPAEFVNRQMSRSQSRRVVLLLDCCYSGAFGRGMMARASPAVDLRDRFQGRGRIVLTASSAMEYAFEDAELSAGRGQPSVFTHALVQGLETGVADRNGDGYIDVDELYDHVFEEVRQAASKQTPGRWDFDMQGDLLIARSPRPRPVPLPAELRQALDHPLAAVRLAAIEELARLLRAGHAGFALAAAATLQELTRDDSQRVSAAAAAALAAQGGEVPVPAAELVTAPASLPLQAPPPPHPRRLPPPDAPRPTAPPTRTASPPARPAGRRRRPGRPATALTVPLLVLVVLLGIWRLGDRGAEVEAGRPFQAVSPWRLQVEGRGCAVTVYGADGAAAGAGHGDNYALQIRGSGRFVVGYLTPGCAAAVVPGAGGAVALPFTLEPSSDGAGGDSAPFHSPGSFRVAISGSDCQTRIHRASDGSQVDELSGAGRSEINQPGDFYVHSDARCTTRVEPI